MANDLDINLKQAKQDMTDLLALTVKQKQAFLDAADAALKINSISVKTPGQLNTATSSNAHANASLSKQASEITQNQAKIQQAYEKTRVAELRLQAQREKAVDSFNRNEEKQQQALAASTNQYNIIQKEVNKLTLSYNNLAIKQELGLKLTTKEQAQLSAIIPQLNQYQNALKKVDADIGKYGRNVGNYESGTRNLNASIGQISRELPNFGQSFSIGVLSLTNNIGALQDAIKQTIAQNEILKSEGKATTSVLGSIGGAIFSWTTALYIGIGVFSAYSGEIGEFLFSTKSAKKAQEDLKKVTEEKIETEKRANQEIGNSIAQETSRTRILFEVGKNEKNNSDQRKKAFDELKDRYGKYLGDLTQQEFLAGNTADAEERLNVALINRGYALGAQSLLQKNAEAQLEIQVELEKTIAKGFGSAEKLRNAQGAIIGSSEDYYKVLRSVNKANQEAQKIAADKLKPLKEEEAVLLALFNRNSMYLDAVKETNTNVKNGSREKLESQKLEKQSVDSLLKSLEAQVQMIKELQGTLSENNSEWKMYQKSIEDTEKAINAIKNGFTELKDSAQTSTDFLSNQARASREAEAAMNELRESTESYIKSIATGFFSEAGLGSLTQFFDGTFDKLMFGADTLAEKFALTFNAIGDVAKEAFAFISQASQANFEAEINRLDKQREYAVQFAGDSVSAKEAIEEQYESKRKQIQKRQAEAQKKLSLFNIAINTAQGVTAALALGPIGIPLAAVIGVLGLVQASLVNAQQIPQFFKGGKHKGGVMMVNDAKGSNYRETVVTPSGQIIQPTGRNVLMDAPAGTQIYTPEQWQKESLKKMLSERGVSMHPAVMQRFDNKNNTQNIDLSGVIKAINDKPTTQLSIDKKGISAYTFANNQRTERLNSRFNITD